MGSTIMAGGPGEDVQARACLRGGSRTKLLPRARCRLLLSLSLPEGGQRVDNGPHSPASRPWPLELGRELTTEAAASAGPSRSPRPACWVALITQYVPGAHMPTLCRGKGTRGLRWMGPVGSEAFCSSPTPKRGLSRSLGEYPTPLAPSCQVPTLNYSFPLGLRGLAWERRKRPTSSYNYSGSPAHKYQLCFNIVCSMTLYPFNTWGIRGTERLCNLPTSHSW